MDIHRPKEKLSIIIVFLLPLLLVKGGAIVTGSGPAKVQAGPVPKNTNPKITPVPDPPTWSTVQREAAEHITYLKTQPFGPSPLLHVAPPPPPDRGVIKPPPTRKVDPPPDVRVKMILTRSDGNHVALIDRKRYVVGDALGDRGWYIIEIDGPARAVTIEHRLSGSTASLTVPLPR
ncbi:MAG: hypothetical protein ACYTGF_02535 [Planctomycetota bacterium]|jgi:hypothetical protein